MTFGLHTKNGNNLFFSNRIWYAICEIFEVAQIFSAEKLECLQIHGWCSEEISEAESAQMAEILAKRLRELAPGQSLFPNGRTVMPNVDGERDEANDSEFVRLRGVLEELERFCRTSGGFSGG